MWRRGTELPVLPGGGNLAEHVLVEIALGVAVGHVDVVELVDYAGQHPRRGHHEDGVLHMLRVGRVLLVALAEGLDEGKDLVLDGLEHGLRGHLLEARPAQGDLLLGEDRVFDGFAGARGLGFLQRVQLVEPLDEQQVGELLDDRERVRDAPGPHRVPDLIYFRFEFAGNHMRLGSPAICRWTMWLCLPGLLGLPGVCRLGRVFGKCLQILLSKQSIAVGRVDPYRDLSLFGPCAKCVL